MQIKTVIAILCGGLLLGCAQPASDAPEADAPEAVGPDAAVAESAPLNAAAIHAKALVLDAHADIEIPGQETRYAGDDGRSQVAPDKMAAGGVDAVVMAIAVGPGPDDAAGFAAAQAQAAAELAAVVGIAAEANLVLARSAEELEAAHQAGQGALILGMQNARLFGGDVAEVDRFFNDGVRVFGLTHMGHNAFADSSRPTYLADLGRHEEEAHGGLSELGRAAITRINDLGGVVDISQLSQKAATQVLEMSRAPVIASHSNVQALTNVRRNLSDDELDLLARNGGVIHIAPFRGYLFDSNDAELDRQIREVRRAAGLQEDYFYPFELYWELDDPEVQATFLSGVSNLLGPGSVDAMLNHIDYVVQRIGVDHVGIGTDFNHGSGIEGFQDASEALNITRGLLDRGYTPAEIEKIWGGNFLRVWRQAAKAAAL